MICDVGLQFDLLFAHHCKLYCLVTDAHRCKQLAQGSMQRNW